MVYQCAGKVLRIIFFQWINDNFLRLVIYYSTAFSNMATTPRLPLLLHIYLISSSLHPYLLPKTFPTKCWSKYKHLSYVTVLTILRHPSPRPILLPHTHSPLYVHLTYYGFHWPCYTVFRKLFLNKLSDQYGISTPSLLHPYIIYGPHSILLYAFTKEFTLVY